MKEFFDWIQSSKVIEGELLQPFTKLQAGTLPYMIQSLKVPELWKDTVSDNMGMHSQCNVVNSSEFPVNVSNKKSSSLK